MSEQFGQHPDNAGAVVFQGYRELDMDGTLKPHVAEALAVWRRRADPTRPEIDWLCLDETMGFAISYDGKSSNHWPDAASNQLGKTLVRGFLFEDGICNVTEMTPRLFRVAYHVVALQDNEYLLVAPFPSETGAVGGLIVVCVNRVIDNP